MRYRGLRQRAARTTSQRLQAGLRDLDPAYFALVMATGIVSRAMRLDHAEVLSAVLLVWGMVSFVVLTAAYAWRFAAYRSEFGGDARDPRRAFGYFTFAAAANVLAVPLAAGRHVAAAAVLLALGAAAWLLLSYLVPMLLGGIPSRRPALSGATGSWFIWAVGVQSVALAASAFPPPVPAPLSALAICCWAVGVMLYLVIAVLVPVARLEFTLGPADQDWPYWVFMGATAISVLAGAQILRLPDSPLAAAVRGVLPGLSVMLWAFGTWLIPLLTALVVRRHLVHGVRLRYEPALWSMVFPLGMYGVASRELGAVLHVPWLEVLGRYEAWVALAAWAVVTAGMCAAAFRMIAPPAGTLPASEPGR